MLTVQIYTNSDATTLLADWSAQASPSFGGGGLRFSTNRHGFAALELPLVRVSPAEAFAVYEWPGTPHVVVSDAAAGVVWEGRVEDIGIVANGVTVRALGYQRALYDVPYSALWSVTTVSGWEPVTSSNLSGHRPGRYQMDTNNRLYISPTAGETFGDGTHAGAMTLAIPHRSDRKLKKFACSYEMVLPTDWKFRVITYDDAFGSSSTINTVTANGTTQTGTLDLNLSDAERVNIDIRNNTTGDSTIPGDTGDYYLRLTGVRVKSTTSSDVYASEIVRGIVTYVSGINSGQLGSGKIDIEATTIDLDDALYEDATPAAILDELATLHRYEWGVYERQQLYFRPLGTGGRAWYVDVVTTPELDRTLETVRTSAYGVYQNAAGQTRRTIVATADGELLRYGIVRREALDVSTTTSATEAALHRDLFLDDRASAQGRGYIEFNALHDAAGGRWPLWMARAGDTVTMRNLPPTLTTDIDRIRTFRIGETDFDATTGRLTLAPEEPTPTLVTLVARREAGLY